MQRNRWSRDFDWVKSGTTYYQQDRLEKYNENRFIAVGDVYFKLNKYLTGVTFSYINSLNDIYKRDLLTGDGFSIVNMYNEYNVIDRVLKNIVFVDVASTTQIDLNTQWTTIDGIKLKPGHLVLLYNQDSEFQNDIYKVNNQYFLQNAGLLISREKSNKFSCSVKLGTQRDKQFFLVNNGFDFPTTYEPKFFIEGKSYLLKNLIKYNIYNTATNSAITSKIIFTDYEFARKQLVENYNLFNDFSISLSGVSSTDYFFNLTYHHDEYKIRTGATNLTIGPISAITNSTYALGSMIPVVSGSNFKVGDYLQIRFLSDTGITGFQYLTMKTFVKEVQDINSLTIDGGDAYAFLIGGGSVYDLTGVTLDFDVDGDLVIISSDIDGGFASGSTIIGTIDGSGSIVTINNLIVIEDAIPNHILKNLSAYTFEITNLNVARNWIEAVDFLGKTKFNDFYDVEILSTISGDTIGQGSINISTKESKYDKYFDYNGIGLYLPVDLYSRGFTTTIQYIKYNLWCRLNDINNVVFLSTMAIFNMSGVSISNYSYTDNGRIRLITNISGITNIFRPYTYVDVTSSVGSSRALVYSVKEYEIIIEKPIAWGELPVINYIQNIDGLQTISDILYEVYMNVTYDWYIQKADNERKYICKTYAQILTENESFRMNVTGILYENEKNEFILKLYDIENDQQLRYSPIELSFIGADRKTRLPVPLREQKTPLKSQTFLLDSDWNVISGGVDDNFGTSEFEILDLGFNSVIGGVNNPPVTFTLINGNEM